MATTKLLTEILAEMKNIQTDIAQNGKNKNKNRSRSISTVTQCSQRAKTPARKLLNEIANRPIPIITCWYHKKHGIATNPNSCPGPPACSWDQTAEVTKMKQLIQKVTKTSTPAQKRISMERAKQPYPTINFTPKINLPTPKMNLPIQTTSSVQPLAADFTSLDKELMDWAAQAAAEHQKNEEMEQELLNVSE